MMQNSPAFTLLFNHRYLLLLLLLTCAIFYKGITPSFSSDDFVHLESNIHFASLAEAAEVFVSPYGREYRPLVRLSLWLNSRMGDSALAYKISNLLMHLLCVALVYGLLLRLGAAKITALVASSLFALHPIHTTSVHFILGRTDLLASVFYLATLYCVAGWKEQPSWLQQVLTLAGFSAALLTKELSITLPVMMLAILWVQRQRFSLKSLCRTALSLWPYALISLIYLTLRVYQWQAMSDAVAVYTNFSLKNILLNYAQWLFALLYPFDLYVALEWQMLHSALFAALALGLCLLAAAVALYLWLPRIKHLLRSPLLWLGIGWIGITLIPMMGGNAHRWYLYLPSVGLSLILAAAWPQVTGGRTKWLTGLMVLTLTVYAGETLRQSLIWHKQGKITEQLLASKEAQEMRKYTHIAIANMPFGYQSAFLFTHSSFEEAMRVRYGKSPHIQVLSYLNMDEKNPITMVAAPNGVSFSMPPNAHRYFRLRNMQIFFAQASTYSEGDYTLKVDHLDAAGRITNYTLTLPQPHTTPIYYFNGEQFQRLPEHTTTHSAP